MGDPPPNTEAADVGRDDVSSVGVDAAAHDRTQQLIEQICAEHPDIAEMMKDVDVSLMRLQLAMEPLDRWRNATAILRWRGAARAAAERR